ncbi:MAG: RHS repeat-associated core domain-containing protein [Nitrospira sp.]|nr:RHS repeat-associated core domain-containing protein [Nitrospira sp.]
MSTWNRVSPVNASDNGDGGRVKKTVTSDGNTTTTTYIGKLYVCEGSSWAKMIFAGGQRIAIKQVGSGSISDFHPDHLGSTSVLTHASGAKEEDLVDYPYGETYTNTGTANVAYKYTGKELDDSTGLYIYEARYYDAVLGRFISADSIVPDPTNPQAFNRYSYVFNNPLRFIDPLGMKPCQVDGCVGEDIFTLPEVLVQDTHITPSENTRSSEGTDSGTPFGTSSQGPFLSSPPSSESETLPSAACCDLTDVIGAPLRGIKAGIGIFGIIGGIKNVGTQALISNPFKVIDRASKSLIKIAPKFGKNPEDLLNSNERKDVQRTSY